MKSLTGRTRFPQPIFLKRDGTEQCPPGMRPKRGAYVIQCDYSSLEVRLWGLLTEKERQIFLKGGSRG